jgi:hypothetical protein
MKINHNSVSKLIVFLIVTGLISCNACAGFGAREKAANASETPQVMTEAELQSMIMSFADRYTAILSQALYEFDSSKPSKEKRRPVRHTIVYSMSSAFTIAAESDPDVALLDMVVMVTLGRLIFEEHWKKEIGSQVDPIVRAFRTAEKDIWRIAAEVLSPEQQKELMNIIVERRRMHPHILTFAYIRFHDFSAERRNSKLLRAEKGGGLFRSVETATQQVEDMKLMAERGMYLGTRLPMMTGAFADEWLSQVFVNPEINRLSNDIHKFAEVSERLTVVAENMPKLIAEERSAAINQLMSEFSAERKKAMQDLFAEEQRVQALLVALRGTLNDGNNLLTTANALAGKLNLGQPAANGGQPDEPMDIKDIQVTLVEASNTMKQVDALIQSFDRLMMSPGWKNSLPRIVSAVDKIEDEGRSWVAYAAMLGVGLIAFLLIGSVLAALTYKFITLRIFAADTRKGKKEVVLSKTD